MKHLLLLLSVTFFLGCASTTLLYRNDTIALKSAENTIELSGKTLRSFQQNLGRISVRQYLFEEEHNEILVYEYARLDMGYTFKYNYQYALTQIFDAKAVKKIQESDGVGFFRISLKDGSGLNAVVKTSTKKSLDMLYGFSDENFQALIDGKNLRMQKSKTIKTEDAIRSRWNMKLIITGVLLEQQTAAVPPVIR